MDLLKIPFYKVLSSKLPNINYNILQKHLTYQIIMMQKHFNLKRKQQLIT